MTLRNLFPVTALCAVTLCGCDPFQNASEAETQARASRLYANAMDDLQAGRLDAAIRGFERVTLDEPKSYSAHFQLATLLQDAKKDYIGAIAHYREYLARRPRSDKATIAQDRIRLCETQLAAEYAKKTSGTDVLQTENARLTSTCRSLEGKVAKLERELEQAKRKADTLANEVATQRSLLKKIAAADDGASAPPVSAAEALAQLRAEDAAEKRRRVKPTDAELLDDEDQPSGTDDRIRNSEDVKRLRAELSAEDAAAPATPRPAAHGRSTNTFSSAAFDGLFGDGKKNSTRTHPETYVVQEGDTLFAISTRFYGSSRMWRRIRELNKATIPPDGRVLAGQEIKLP